MIVVVVVVCVNVAGVAQVGALIGTVSFLLALVAGDIVKSLPIQSGCCLSKGNSVLLGIIVIVIVFVVFILSFVMGNGCSVTLMAWSESLGHLLSPNAHSLLGLVWAGWMLEGSCIL